MVNRAYVCGLGSSACDFVIYIKLQVSEEGFCVCVCVCVCVCGGGGGGGGLADLLCSVEVASCIKTAWELSCWTKKEHVDTAFRLYKKKQIQNSIKAL
jgi:hypothetical protein